MGAKVNKSVCFEVFPERGLLLDLVRFLMAHLLRTHGRERVIRPSSSMAFSCTALPSHLSLTHFRLFPEPEVRTAARKHKGPLHDHFRAQVPVRKGTTAILISRQQPPRFHRSFPSVGPTWLTGQRLGSPLYTPHSHAADGLCILPQ